MKNIVLFTLVLALAFAVVFGAFAAPSVLSGAYAAKMSPNVGWNSMACTGTFSAQHAQQFAIVIRPPVYQPMVGWNS